MTEIIDKEIYLSRMEASLVDKMYFMDIIGEEVGLVVDFGCANGALTVALADLYPNVMFYGYDTNEDFLDEAIHNNNASNTFYSSNWAAIKIAVETYHREGKKAALNLSSVLHEIGTYCGIIEENLFWEGKIGGVGWDYVCIRDMGMRQEEAFCRCELPDFSKESPEFHNRLEQFKQYWMTSMDNTQAVYHFLLKKDYVENWKRELGENYFFFSVDDVELCMQNVGYSQIYLRHWVLPYFKNKIKQEYNYDIKYNTHYKMVWKRNGS